MMLVPNQNVKDEDQLNHQMKLKPCPTAPTFPSSQLWRKVSIRRVLSTPNPFGLSSHGARGRGWVEMDITATLVKARLIHECWISHSPKTIVALTFPQSLIW